MTCEYCSIFNEPYKMINLWSLLHLFNGAKRMGFVLTFVFTEMNAQFQCNYIRYGTIIQQVYSSFNHIWYTKQNINIEYIGKIFLTNINRNFSKCFLCNNQTMITYVFEFARMKSKSCKIPHRQSKHKGRKRQRKAVSYFCEQNFLNWCKKTYKNITNYKIS